MNAQCLTSDEVGEVLSRLLDPGYPLVGNLELVLSLARSWEWQIVCHNLFVARHLDVAQRGREKIGQLYAARDEMALEAQEGGVEFVEYLLRHERDAGESLDDAMIVIQERLSAHDYERAIRY